MPDTSTLNLKCSIAPIKDFTVDNFAYGYTFAKTSVDTDDNYLPLDENLYVNIIMQGLRPYRTFDSVTNLDLTEAIQGIVSGGNVEITSVTDFNKARKGVTLVKQDRVLQENFFDCDNYVFEDIPLTTMPELKPSDKKDEEFRYFNTWMDLNTVTGTNYIDIVMDDGSNTPSYRFSFVPYIINYSNHFENRSSLAYKVEVTLNSGSESSKTKTAKRMIADTIKRRGLSGSMPSDIQGKDEGLMYAIQKQSFSFRTKHQSYSDLNQFQSLTLGDKYGVLIYEDSANKDRDLLNSISSVKVADFSNCLFFGYCDIAGFDNETNEIEWSGYYYKLPEVANFMNYAKSDQLVNNSEFTSNITGWTANGSATATHDSSNERIEIGGLASTSDYVEFTMTTAGVDSDYYLLEFDVFNYSLGGVDAYILVQNVGATIDVFDVKITGNGHYSFISEDTGGEILTSPPKVYVKSGSGSATSLDLDNVKVWSIGL